MYPPLSSFLIITQNPSGVLTACAGGHVGMLDRELAALLSLVHIHRRRTCAATRASRRPSTRWSPIEISTTRTRVSAKLCRVRSSCNEYYSLK